jgi:hypothetical protein
MLRRAVETAGRSDEGRWEQLVSRAALAFPPQYLAVPGSPVYHIQAGDQAVLIAEPSLTGPVRELVVAVLTEGGAR